MEIPNQIKAIITGATGMVGEGVLLECLQNPLVESVLIINRRPSGYQLKKLNSSTANGFFNNYYKFAPRNKRSLSR